MSEDVPFSRDEENRMVLLEGKESLTADEEVELAQIKVRYHRFLDEGEAKLRQTARELEKQREVAENKRQQGSLLSNASKAVYFWGSLVATAVPGYFGRQTGVTDTFLHWNFVTDFVVMGALPVVTRVGNSGNHLAQLRTQLEEKGTSLGLVVACLLEEEMKGFGVDVIQFARKEDWISVFGNSIEYIHIPIEDTLAAAPLDVVVEAVERMDSNVRASKCVYVHCKAGKGRSWMIVVCYLTTMLHMEYHSAVALVKQSRSQVNPSEDQQRFARAFKNLYADFVSRREAQPNKPRIC